LLQLFAELRRERNVVLDIADSSIYKYEVYMLTIIIEC